MISSIVTREDKDEIKRYSGVKDGLLTIIAVFEGDYVHFAKELKNGELGEEKIILQEFEILVK
jgi:hypothetical protein